MYKVEQIQRISKVITLCKLQICTDSRAEESDCARTDYLLEDTPSGCNTNLSKSIWKVQIHKHNVV